MQKVELIILQSKEEYYQEYLKNYVDVNFNLVDIPVIFSAKDFDHIFFEPRKEMRPNYTSRTQRKIVT